MVSETALAKTTVGTLLGEVSAAFADSFTLPDNFLVHAYNHAAETLALLDPAADGKKTVTAANKAYGKLSEEQKSFVNPENAAYLENEVLPRLKELQDNIFKIRRAATIRCTSARCQPL